MEKQEQGVQFAKSVKAIDWLRIEILEQTSNLFKGVHHANQHMIMDSLSSLLVSTYILGRRMGFSFRELDQVVVQKLREHAREGHQLEQWYGSLSEMEDYFSRR